MFVDGVILKMEFLYPPRGDDNHVILLLVVNNEGRTHLVRYEWDCTACLSSIGPVGMMHPVRRQEQLPLLLIPSTMSTGFLLVCETIIAQYDNILIGYRPPRYTAIDNEEPPEEAGSSRRRPLWTQWARPIRRDGWESNNDAIYLCREDGVVRFYEFLDSQDQYCGRQSVGRLEINVDTAFASLDVGTRYHDLHEDYDSHDILIVSGNMSDGGLYIFRPRQNAQKQQSIACWAPIIDSTVSAVTMDTQGLDTEIRPYTNGFKDRERLFACCGKGSRHGGICEMRYGIKALSTARINIEPLGIAGIVGMWILPAATGTLVLLTDPSRTYGLLVDVNDGEVKDVSDELCEGDSGLDIHARTLAAASTANKIVVQITEHSIRAILPESDRPFRQSLEEDTKILAGYIQESASLILVAVSGVDSIYLSVRSLCYDGTEITLSHIGEPVPLSSIPSCISLQIVGSQVFALIGTVTGSIQLFQGNSDRQLCPLLDHRFEGDFAICDSVAVLAKHVEGTQHNQILILCGLRNGTLQVFQLQPPEGKC